AKIQKTVGGKMYEKNRRDILLEAAQLCIDIIRLNMTMTMLDQRLKNSATLHQMYDKRMAAGDANILEVNKVKLDCMEVQTMVSEAQNERMLLLQQLQQLNGGKPVTIDSEKFPEFQPIKDFES
ncbi:MAG: TolC family protein, partial [Prevotella sp.]